MHRHFLVYKPYRMVSQFLTNDSKQKRKKFLGELYDFPAGSMAIGRLDEKSEGLLLITTDGKLSDSINRSGIVEKEYYTQLDGVINDSQINQLKSGVEIGINGTKYKTQPCHVQRLTTTPILPDTIQKIRDARHGPTSWIAVTLLEGKFRQVRKMTSAVGFPTLRLARIRIGFYTIERLQKKVIIELDDNEIRTLLLNND